MVIISVGSTMVREDEAGRLRRLIYVVYNHGFMIKHYKYKANDSIIIGPWTASGGGVASGARGYEFSHK